MVLFLTKLKESTSTIIRLRNLKTLISKDVLIPDTLIVLKLARLVILNDFLLIIDNISERIMVE